MINVTLREKKISKGRKSLYLDFYPAITLTETGKTTRRQFLGIYILDKPKTTSDKVANKEKLMIAEQILQKKYNELNKPEIYSEEELAKLEAREKGKLSFIAYFEEQMESKTAKNYQVWQSAFNYLKEFFGDEFTFAELTERKCNDFREYISNAKSIRSPSKKIKQNTAHSYFNKFKATLKQAFKDGLLTVDINGRIDRIKEEESQRVRLSLEELNKLVKTDCVNPQLKNAALFSALTGLRFSDIEKLLWKDILYSAQNGYSIDFRQKKNILGFEYHPISEQAFTYLGERKESSDRIYEGLYYSAHINNQLLKWMMSAGITKHITFHCFRHTYATLQLQNNTDIYTVSKMLGHKDVRTTQRYAKVVDESKRKTTDRIRLDLDKS